MKRVLLLVVVACACLVWPAPANARPADGDGWVDRSAGYGMVGTGTRRLVGSITDRGCGAVDVAWRSEGTEPSVLCQIGAASEAFGQLLLMFAALAGAFFVLAVIFHPSKGIIFGTIDIIIWAFSGRRAVATVVVLAMAAGGVALSVVPDAVLTGCP